MLFLLAIVCPPLAVLFTGKPIQAILNLVLTLIFWIPGVIHAMFIVLDHKNKKRLNQLRVVSNVTIVNDAENGIISSRNISRGKAAKNEWRA